MKRSLGIRDRLLVAGAGLLGPILIRLLGATWRVHVRGDDVIRATHESGRRVIHAFWHGHLLGLEYAYRGSGICVLSSWHRDGEISARLMTSLGYQVVRGSSSHGSARGLILMLARLRAGSDLAVTPDGPRGPARVVKPGIFYLSDKSGAPIIPVSVWSSPSRRLKSWDGFTVPLPFATVVVVHGAPIEPGAEGSVEERAERLGRSLEALQEAAEEIGVGRGPR